MLEKNRDIFYHNPADWGKYRIERRTRIRCPNCGTGYWIQGDIPEQMSKPAIPPPSWQQSIPEQMSKPAISQPSRQQYTPEQMREPTISPPAVSQPSWQQYIPELERLQVDIEAIIQKLKNIRLVE